MSHTPTLTTQIEELWGIADGLRDESREVRMKRKRRSEMNPCANRSVVESLKPKLRYSENHHYHHNKPHQTALRLPLNPAMLKYCDKPRGYSYLYHVISRATFRRHPIPFRPRPPRPGLIGSLATLQAPSHVVIGAHRLCYSNGPAIIRGWSAFDRFGVKAKHVVG